MTLYPVSTVSPTFRIFSDRNIKARDYPRKVGEFFKQVDKHMGSLKETITRLVGSFPKNRNLGAQQRDVEVQRVLKGVNVSGLPGFVALPNIS